MEIQDKELKETPVIMVDGQTNMDLDSAERIIGDEGQGTQQNAQTKPKKYILTEQDNSTLKLAKGLVICNLIGFVFLFIGCAVIYTTLTVNWNDSFMTSFQLFIFSDILLIGEKILFFVTLINKRKVVKLCPFLNVVSLMLKVVASGLVVHTLPCEIIVSLILILLQMPHNILIKIITKRWKCIPERKWKKQLVLVRKPLPNQK